MTSSKRDRGQPVAITRGIRVRRSVPGSPSVIGFVASAPVNGFVDVFPEGSSTSRSEPWCLKQVEPLPLPEQLPLHGGSFQPPKGYPFTSPRSSS